VTATVVRPEPTAARRSALTAEIAGYRLDGQLADGRRGPVLGGVRRSDGLAVAVHLVDHPLDGRQRRRFTTETTRLRSLPDTPVLQPIIDAGLAADGRAYLVTPRADLSLADRLATEGTLPPAEAAAAGVAAATGLEVLHRAGVLHGNVTAANLLVLPSGGIALSGLAVPVLAELDSAEPVPGRPPEVLQGAPWSAAADVYALGWTLWTLLTGKAPYGGSDDVVLRVLTEAVPELPRDAAPDGVRDAVRAALAKDPADRPAPAALAAHLEGAAAVVTGRRDTVPPTAPIPPADAVQGRPLGSGYVLQELIGRGATGQVWRGVRRADGRAVAVKVLRSELAEDPEAVTRFLRERTTLVGITHPHLVQVRDLVAEGSTLAIVMDLVDGPDLRRLLAAADGGRLDPVTAVTLLAQVAAGLAAVHAAGIVHRDVKPENVLVERSGAAHHARLTDFGVARLPAGQALTGMGRLTGTPEYVAPELATGRVAAPASDVYSFGVVAYEILAGRRPFDAPNPIAVLRAHVEDEPSRPAELAEPVWKVIRSCLAKEPADRPSAARVATSLAALAPAPLGLDVPAAGAPARTDPGIPAAEPLLTTEATVPAPPAPAEPPPRRKRRLALPLALAVLVVAGVGGIAGLAVGRLRAPAPADSIDPPAYSYELVDVPVVASSPDQGMVTLQFNGGPDKPGFQYYVIFRNDQIFKKAVAGAATSYDVLGADPEAKHCYRVAAFVATTATPSPHPKKAACVTADGDDTATGR
jgi:serine/threonine protein kinase